MNFKTIAIASDHAGFEYKQAIKEHLVAKGLDVTDFGTDSDQSCDYPDFIQPAAQAVSEGAAEGGIVLGGSGNGEAIAANRFNGVRCALCWDENSARLGRQHNNANMISLGSRMMGIETALKIVDIWLSEEFEGGRHIPRIEKIDQAL